MRAPGRPGLGSVSGRAGTLATTSGLVLALSAFMGWYSTRTELATVSVTGWHTGTLGKLVFFTGLAVLVLLLLEQTGLELPPTFPVGAAIAGLGALGTIFVAVRVIDIPDRLTGTGRSVGLWISFLSALAVVVSGLLKASEEVESSTAA
jgi:hypothetical protein